MAHSHNDGNWSDTPQECGYDSDHLSDLEEVEHALYSQIHYMQHSNFNSDTTPADNNQCEEGRTNKSSMQAIDALELGVKFVDCNTVKNAKWIKNNSISKNCQTKINLSRDKIKVENKNCDKKSVSFNCKKNKTIIFDAETFKEDYSFSKYAITSKPKKNVNSQDNVKNIKCKNIKTKQTLPVDSGKCKGKKNFSRINNVVKPQYEENAISSMGARFTHQTVDVEENLSKYDISLHGKTDSESVDTDEDSDGSSVVPLGGATGNLPESVYLGVNSDQSHLLYDKEGPPNSPHDKWWVDDVDRERSVGKEKSRYYVECSNCRMIGHLAINCPQSKRQPVCKLCGIHGHFISNCSHIHCRWCKSPGRHHTTRCNGPASSIVCLRCNLPGHITKLCPDLWRRYHSTTQCGETLRRAARYKSLVFCSNCGKRHLYHQCVKRRMFNEYHITSSPHVISYCPDFIMDDKWKKQSESKVKTFASKFMKNKLIERVTKKSDGDLFNKTMASHKLKKLAESKVTVFASKFIKNKPIERVAKKSDLELFKKTMTSVEALRNKYSGSVTPKQVNIKKQRRRNKNSNEVEKIHDTRINDFRFRRSDNVNLQSRHCGNTLSNAVVDHGVKFASLDGIKKSRSSKVETKGVNVKYGFNKGVNLSGKASVLQFNNKTVQRVAAMRRLSAENCKVKSEASMSYGTPKWLKLLDR